MTVETVYKGFADRYIGRVQYDQPLAPYSTYRTGGPADIFVNISTADELSSALKLAAELGIPYFVIGGGSNLLISDDGFRGLIIRNSIMGLRVQADDIICGAGEDLDRLVDFATEHSLTGLEFGAGIWGTVGGAVYGNAGAFGSQISSVLSDAELVDRSGDRRTADNTYFKFQYRHSYLKVTHEIVATARFTLQSGKQIDIARRVDEIRQLRCQKHPTIPNSAGCFFKNIEDPSQPNGKLPAGKLLDEVGAKEISIGGAKVFEKHANIIINTGHATSKDIRMLADTLKRKVLEKFNIELQEEVMSIGAF